MNDLTVSNDPLLASSDNNTPVSSDSNTQNDSSGRKYQCKICLQMFSSANTRYRHKQKAHPDYRQTEYRNFVCIQPNCPAGFRYTWQYWKHLEDQHADSVKLEVDVLKFASFNEFLTWKGAIEQETRSQYVLNGGNASRKVESFHCNRFGTAKLLPDDQRVRSKDCRKLCRTTRSCPAAIFLYRHQISAPGDEPVKYEYEVKFFKTHLGHGFEPPKVNLKVRNRLSKLTKPQDYFKKLFEKQISGINFADLTLEKLEQLDQHIKLIPNLVVKTEIVEQEGERQEEEEIIVTSQSIRKRKRRKWKPT